jgi:hypothetical protein
VGSGECAVVIWLFTVWGRLLLLRQQHCNSVWTWLLLLMHSICHKLCNNTFDVCRAVHCNIISMGKPTRCTNVSNLFYFGMTPYMSFHPSSGVQDCIHSNRHLSNRYCCLLDKCLLLYVQFRTPDDGQIDRPKHVECHSKIK